MRLPRTSGCAGEDVAGTVRMPWLARGASGGRGVRRWLALPVVALLAGCSSSPVVLSEGDFSDVTIVEQNSRFSIAPGWTWCQQLSPLGLMESPVSGTWLEIGGGPAVGATILDRSDRGDDADDLLEEFRSAGEQCAVSARSIGTGRVIEPLDTGRPGVSAWRTADRNGMRGEFAVMPLDDARVLAVGFVTDQEDPPADLDDLIRLAEQGARQVLSGRG